MSYDDGVTIRTPELQNAQGPETPAHDCPLCSRLVAFRSQNRADHPDWFNGPVPTFGTLEARLLIVGLAPGLRGANRTGRPFTGDFAGDLLYSTLLRCGLAKGQYEQRADDGLHLIDCAIANAVRCAPPQNKPLPDEIAHCRRFLARTIAGMPHLTAIVALGRIAHDSVVKTLGGKLSAHPFGHGRKHALTHEVRPIMLFDSYHCSRYNTNTGVLTEAMFRALFEEVCAGLKRGYVINSNNQPSGSRK
jgi:uracil-DNA glycosylase family 4